MMTSDLRYTSVDNTCGSSNDVVQPKPFDMTFRCSAGTLKHVVTVVFVAYAAIWLWTNRLASVVNGNGQCFPIGSCVFVSLSIAAAAWLLASYVFCCLLAKRLLSLDIPHLVLTMGSGALGASIGEVCVDSLAVKTLGRPMWTYCILPIYGGYTSQAGSIAWLLYFYYQHFFRKAMECRYPHLIESILSQATLLAVDAIVLETVTNTVSIQWFGSYYFYYYQNDVAHYTSFEPFPVYVLFGCLFFTGQRILDNSGVLIPRAALGVACFCLDLMLIFL